jgi:hypothetical protein
MDIADGKTVCTCGVCRGREELAYEARHRPPGWVYDEALGIVHAKCARVTKKALDAGHLQTRLDL